MALSSETSQVGYTATSGQTDFTVPFRFLEEEHLVVEYRAAAEDEWEVLELDGDYTVTGAGDDAGGEVVLDVGLVTGELLRITRDVPLDQPVDLQTSGPFSPSTLESMVDRAVMGMQQISRDTVLTTELEEVEERVEEVEADIADIHDVDSNQRLDFEAADAALDQRVLTLEGDFEGTPGEVVAWEDATTFTANVTNYDTVQAYRTNAGFVSVRGVVVISATKSGALCTLPWGPEETSEDVAPVFLVPTILADGTNGSRLLVIGPTGIVSLAATFTHAGNDLELHFHQLRFYSPAP